MSKSSGFDRGVLAGMLIVFGAVSGNWLITPAQHPDASTLRTIGVVAQLVLGIGVGAWLIVRERSLQKRQAAAVNTP
ncbi:MAG: hypothetical protein ACXU91_12855 [Gemmatimonadaceae bacterium]